MKSKLIFIIVLTAVMIFCAGCEKKKSLVGVWKSEGITLFEFGNDGTFDGPGELTGTYKLEDTKLMKGGLVTMTIGEEVHNMMCEWMTDDAIRLSEMIEDDIVSLEMVREEAK